MLITVKKTGYIKNNHYYEREGNFFLKKLSFGKKILLLALRILGFQIASIITYFIMVMVVTMVFSDKEANVETPYMLIATLITQTSVLVLAYKPVWLLGEDHAADLIIGKTKRHPFAGLLVGLCAVSPMILAWLMNLLLVFFSFNFNFFSTVLGYLLYSWEPYFTLCYTYLPANAWYAPLIYLPALLPIPLLCQLAYWNGMRGVTWRKKVREYRRVKELKVEK